MLTFVALISSAVPAMVAMFGVGAGVALYVGYLAPIMQTAAPPSHLARVQAALLIAQPAPLLIVTLVLGGRANTLGATVAALVCAVGSDSPRPCCWEHPSCVAWGEVQLNPPRLTQQRTNAEDMTSD